MAQLPAGTPSYAAEQSLAQLVAGAAPPSGTTIDTLSSLALLKKLAVPNSEDAKVVDAAIKHETKYLKTALHALQSNPALSSRFGQGIGAAMSLASILRARHATKVYDSVVDGAMADSGNKFGLETVENSVKRINNPKVIQDRS